MSFLLCTTAGCNSKYKTQQKLKKHVLEKHAIVLTDEELASLQPIAIENKQQASAQRDNVARQKAIDERLQMAQLARQEMAAEIRQQEERALAQRNEALQLEERLLRVQTLVARNMEKAAELSADQSAACCCICDSAPRNAAVSPCGHAVFCYNCITEHFNVSVHCPCCRAEMKEIVRLYQ
jgi:hypothetical protein